MSGFSETAVEDTPLEWLASLGYDVPYGPQIVAGILPAQVNGHNLGGTLNPIPNKAPASPRQRGVIERSYIPSTGQ